MNTVERFSNRVENYIKYRPGYPPETIRLFQEMMRMRPDHVVADIGSGPGISAKLFLENGNTVNAVEPNDAMRAAAEEILHEFPNFKSVKGTAEATTLPEASVDFVISAQAFHWFDSERAAIEFRRILRPDGYVALIWNERQLDSTPFLREYEQFLLRYSTDYSAVRHENVTADNLRDFLGEDMSVATFRNVQVFDFDGLKGRLLSSSYMPGETGPDFDRMIAELRELFARHQEKDRIEVLYDTNIYYAQF